MAGSFDVKDTLKRLVERFWFLRGIAAAMTLAELVPKFTSIEKFDFLRAFHALLVGWNQVAAWVGKMIGRLPLLPNVSADVVNALLFASAVGIPSFCYFAENPDRRRLAWEQSAITAGPGAHRAFKVVLIAAGSGWYLLCYYMVTEILRVPYPTILVWPLVFWMAIPWIVAILKMKGYRHGLVLTITFVAAMQCLYWLNTPWLKDEINALSSKGLEQSAPKQPTPEHKQKEDR